MQPLITPSETCSKDKIFVPESVLVVYSHVYRIPITPYSTTLTLPQIFVVFK